MIELTRFDGSRFFVNAEFIEFVETTPDTIVSLIDHKKLLVRETAHEVVASIIAYQATVGVRNPASVATMARWVSMQQHHTEASAKDGTSHLYEGDSP